MSKNLTLVFKKIPPGIPEPGVHLDVEDRPIDERSLKEGEVSVQILYASLDPYLRNLLRSPDDHAMGSSFPVTRVGDPMMTNCVGKVLHSNDQDVKPGELVKGFLPIQHVTKVKGDSLEKLDSSRVPDIREYLGALGITGLTAYSSFYEICQPKRGETIFISAASGAVGQVVGQLAKREGLKVIGSVGSAEKLEFILKDLGFDGGFNYKEEKPEEALKRLCPKGIDIDYENVGGEQLEAAIAQMNNDGRVCVCGMISQYNRPETDRYGVRNLFMLITKCITMRGFVVAKLAGKWGQEHQEKMSEWLSRGEIKTRISTVKGIEKAAEGFAGMLQGHNFGKTILEM